MNNEDGRFDEGAYTGAGGVSENFRSQQPEQGSVPGYEVPPSVTVVRNQSPQRPVYPENGYPPDYPQPYNDPEANRAAFDALYGEESADKNAAERLLRRDRRVASQRGDGIDGEGRGSGRGFSGRTGGFRGKRIPRPLRWLIRLAIVCVVFLIIYLVIFGPIDRRIAFDAADESAVAATTSQHLPLSPYYVLLLGSDARDEDENEASRTDTMILARVDVVSNKITLISIPRDTMIGLGEYGTQKINAAYYFEGLAGSVEAVEDLMGVQVSEVAMIHFDGLATLVDAIGGITVDVPVDVNDPDYTGLQMDAGVHEMDGETALLFTRVRHGFALGDYQRQIDQALVIEAIFAKAQTLSPTELFAATSSMGDMLKTSLRCYDAIPLLVRMLGGTPTVYQASIPSTTGYVDGISYVIADTDALAQMMAVVDAGGDPNEAGVTAGLEG